MEKVKAEIVIEPKEDGSFWYSVWADFEPGSEETFLLVSGTISKDGSDIKENNKATEECLYKHMSKLFRK